jgi:hypothetical protein
MQHRRHAGGAMEIDHFNPKVKGRKRHRYNNLFLASRYCNGKKHDNWPSAADHEKGVGFINCCVEFDYGKHIFEEADSRVRGVTPAGIYHVRMLDLNAPHFIEERKLRTRIRHLLFSERVLVTEAGNAMAVSRLLREQLEYLIPPIPMLR